MRKAVIALIGAIVFVVAACGGGESVGEKVAEKILEESLENEGVGNVDIDIDEDGDGSVSIDVEGEDGGSISFGGGDIPDELTVPVPSGGDVMTSFVSGGDVIVTLTYPSSEFDSLVDFYEDWTNGESDEFQTSKSTFESAEGVTIRTTIFLSSDSDTAINLTDCPIEDRYDVCVSISESP